jgi:hypothetical protein
VLITYIGSSRAVDIIHTSLTAVNGEPIDVPDDIAKSLLEQTDNWTAAKPDAPKKDGK